MIVVSFGSLSMCLRAERGERPALEAGHQPTPTTVQSENSTRKREDGHCVERNIKKSARYKKEQVASGYNIIPCVCMCVFV